MRKLTEFEFFKNTPFKDFINTMLFNSQEERDNFFTKHYESIKFELPFNFVKDRGTIRVTGNYSDFKGVNYCRFKNGLENNDKWIYAFIPEYTYINDNVVEFNLLIDGIISYCNTQILMNQKNLSIKRQHLNTDTYNNLLPYLKNNDDVIITKSKKYFYKEKKTFKDYNILIQSSVSLYSEFGTVDNPKISSATGCTLDGITSPIDLYLIDKDDFVVTMAKLSKYPWITQNFKKIIAVPKEIINKDMEDLEFRKVNNLQVELDSIVKIVGGSTESYSNFMDKLEKTESQLMGLFDLDNPEDKHLLRNEYTTIELNNWIGGNLKIDTGLLYDGLKFNTLSVGGYENVLSVYPTGYKGNLNADSFLNDSITFNTFDDIPILVDSYNLALSKSANVRANTESNLLTGKVSRILDNDNNIQDRLVSAVSILSNISPLSLGQGLVDEHEFYRSQLASDKDLALSSPQMTDSNNHNALIKKHNENGITVLYSRPNKYEMEKIKNYYKLYGYEVEGMFTELDILNSMTICNYVEFTGNLEIDDVEQSLLEVIKIRFENGVRFYHDKTKPNPFIENISKNKRRL